MKKFIIRIMGFDPDDDNGIWKTFFASWIIGIVLGAIMLTLLIHFKVGVHS